MKKLLPLLFLFVAYQVDAQTFWTEDFGTGCNQGATASAYAGANGAWTVSSTGTNDNFANEWFVSATANNNGAGNCADVCGTNATLHVGNPAVVDFGVDADLQATYLTGVFCISGYCSTTNKRAESPVINCTGMSDITISFIYIEGGDNDLDDAQLMYYDGSNWYTLDVLAKTTTCNTFSGIWTEYSGVLPTSANDNPNVKIGFNWTDNNDSQGSDPSFAVDDIVLASSSACSVDLSATDATCTDSCNGGIVVTSTGASPFAYSWSNGFTSSNLTDLCAGNYSVTMTDASGCTASSSAIINEPNDLVVSDSIIPATCATCADGSASLDITGGTSPYTFTWSNGSTTNSITNILPAVYYVTITDVNGCTTFDSVSVSFIENVPEAFLQSLSIYPNPADNTIKIQYERGNADALISDVTGRKIIFHQLEDNQTQINISQLTPGTYFVQLLQNDKIISVRKLVVMY